MVEMMKAVRQHAFGDPTVLIHEDAPKPAPQPDEILVRVHAIGLNPPDWYLREGYKSLPPEWRPQVAFPLILGTDISGTVETVGADVSTFKPGDEVYSMVRFPEGLAGGSRAYAEYVAVPASHAAPKPAGLGHTHAAAAPMSLLTAWQFLVELGHNVQNPLQPEQHAPAPLQGRTVLVNGAAGGVGHFALQVAKLKGARVIAVASAHNENLLLDLGADEFVDYARTSPEETFRDLDLVVDAVGGPSTGRFLRTLKRGGSLFPIFPLGFAGGDEAKTLGVTVSSTQVRSNGRQLGELGGLLASGSIRAVLDSVYPLADARLAHERASRGHIQGKIVLTVPQS